MYHKIRQVHRLNVNRDQVYRTMTDVHPDGLENREQRKRRVHFFGHDSLMGYQNNAFPLAVYGCMYTANRKVLFIQDWTWYILFINSNPVYPGRW